MKKLIRLTESDLHRIIENSVRQIIKEAKNDPEEIKKAIALEKSIIQHEDDDDFIYSKLTVAEKKKIDAHQNHPMMLEKLFVNRVALARKRVKMYTSQLKSLETTGVAKVQKNKPMTQSTMAVDPRTVDIASIKTKDILTKQLPDEQLNINSFNAEGREMFKRLGERASMANKIYKLVGVFDINDCLKTACEGVLRVYNQLFNKDVHLSSPIPQNEVTSTPENTLKCIDNLRIKLNNFNRILAEKGNPQIETLKVCVKDFSMCGEPISRLMRGEGITKREAAIRRQSDARISRGIAAQQDFDERKKYGLDLGQSED